MRTLIACLFLTSCAYTPEQLAQEGIKTELASKMKPREAAHCYARGAQERSDALTATVLEDGDAYQVTVRMNTIGGGTA